MATRIDPIDCTNISAEKCVKESASILVTGALRLHYRVTFAASVTNISPVESAEIGQVFLSTVSHWHAITAAPYSPEPATPHWDTL